MAAAAEAASAPQGTADLIYSTFLWGSGAEDGWSIAVDGNGSAYVTGGTPSADFPVTAGVFETTFAQTEAYVAKLNVAGSARVYCTFLGGQGTDWGNGITVDSSGRAYVTGATLSANSPPAPTATTGRAAATATATSQARMGRLRTRSWPG